MKTTQVYKVFSQEKGKLYSAVVHGEMRRRYILNRWNHAKIGGFYCFTSREAAKRFAFPTTYGFSSGGKNGNIVGSPEIWLCNATGLMKVRCYSTYWSHLSAKMAKYFWSTVKETLKRTGEISLNMIRFRFGFRFRLNSANAFTICCKSLKLVKQIG